MAPDLQSPSGMEHVLERLDDRQSPGDQVVPVVRRPAWDLLLVCVALYVATAVGRIHEVFPILLPLKLTMLAAVGSIGLCLLQQSGRRRLSLVRSRSTTLLIALVCWGALTVPGALHQGLAFQTWTDFARTAVMFVVLAASVRSTRDVERLFLVYYAVTVVYVAVVISRFKMGSGADWRLGDLYTYDANDLATLIVTAMPLGLYFVVAHRNLVVRLSALTGLGLLAVGLIRSGSRGGFLAFLAVTAFILLFVTTIPVRSRVAGLIVILAVVGGTASDKYWSQMQTIVHYEQDYNMTSDVGRVKIWKRGIGYMLDRPLFGVGMRNFQVAEGTISSRARLRERGVGVWWGAAHNSYVQAGAELGMPGVLLLLALLWTAFRGLRRAARRALRVNPAGTDVSRLAQSLMGALIGFAVGAFFLSLAYSDMLYTLLALSVALAKVARSDVAWSGPAVAVD